MIIDRGEAEVDNHFRWVNILTITLLGFFVFCLCWGLTSQSTIFQSYRDGATASWVINQYFRGVKCLAQGHNTVAVGMYYLFYYTEITIRQETLREWCWWGRCGFLSETKSFVKTAQIWFQNVWLDLIKKTSTHTWWFHSQTAES